MSCPDCRSHYERGIGFAIGLIAQLVVDHLSNQWHAGVPVSALQGVLEELRDKLVESKP
jgi:hypothetical protein